MSKYPSADRNTRPANASRSASCPDIVREPSPGGWRGASRHPTRASRRSFVQDATVSALRPAAPSFDVYREGRPLRWLSALLGVPVEEETHRAFQLVTFADDPCAAVGSDPPETVPVLVVRVGEEAHARLGAHVDDALEPTMPLRLLIDHEPDRVAFENARHGNEVRRSIRPDRRQPRHSSGSEARSSLLLVHLAAKRTSRRRN